MTDPSKILLTGVNTGGLAALHWTNLVYKLYQYPFATKVLCAPDSAFFINYESYSTKTKLYEKKMKSLFGLSGFNANVLTNTGCDQKFVKEPWQCMFPANFIKDVKAPVFII